MIAALLLLATAGPSALRSTSDLGKAEGLCRVDERGPAFIVDAVGLKDRAGLLKLEVYPAENDDFLADDNVLIAAGKTFRRVEAPASETSRLCIRLPRPGRYALALLHDRDSNHKFGLSVDGIGFSNNPRLGLSKPRAVQVAVDAGAGLTPVAIRLNYRHGLFTLSPEGSR